MVESQRLKMAFGPLTFDVNEAANKQLNQRESVFSNSHFQVVSRRRMGKEELQRE